MRGSSTNPAHPAHDASEETQYPTRTHNKKKIVRKKRKSKHKLEGPLKNEYPLTALINKKIEHTHAHTSIHTKQVAKSTKKNNNQKPTRPKVNKRACLLRLSLHPSAPASTVLNFCFRTKPPTPESVPRLFLVWRLLSSRYDLSDPSRESSPFCITFFPAPAPSKSAPHFHLSAHKNSNPWPLEHKKLLDTLGHFFETGELARKKNTTRKCLVYCCL